MHAIANTIAARQADGVRRHEDGDASVAVVIKVTIGMIPTNLSNNLGWQGYKAVLQLYHMGKFASWEKWT